MIMGKWKVYNTETFIKEAKRIFPNYDYSQTIYVKSKQKLKIICPKHGAFWITPNSLLRGSGCSKCKFEKESKLFQYTTEQFINLARNIHGNKYDYSQIKFPLKIHEEKIPIICKKHGIFYQNVHNHLKGAGCPKCKSTRGENLILKILDNFKIKYIKEYRICINNKQYRVDFYLPEHNLIIEYNGIQHYIPIKCFGGLFQYFKQILRDAKIKRYCRKNNIDLMTIKYNENVNDKLNKIIM